MRADLGLNPVDRHPTPIPPPVTFPMLSVEGIGPLQAGLRVVDVTTPTRRARPFGTIGCELWVKIGGAAPESLDACRYMMLATRNRAVLTFPGTAANQTAYVIGRWINERGQPGPCSAVVAVTVAATAGGPLVAAA